MFCFKIDFPSIRQFYDRLILVEKFLLLLSAPCITPSTYITRSIFLSSLRSFRGRRRRDKIFLPYRVPIKIGYP